MRLTAWINTGLLLGWMCASAHAEIYQWTDADGQTRYSDQPPLNRDYVVKDVNPAPATTLPPAPADEPASEDAIDHPAPEQPTTDPAVLKQQCSRARERLAFYERTPAVRVLYKNKSGETVRMTPEERTSRMSRYRTLSAKSCKSSPATTR